MSSATGSWYIGTRAFDSSLAELREWRDAISTRLAEFRRWGVMGRMMDEQTAARLAHLERRLAGERLTIAFVSEVSRGKSELINALFFSDMGTRLLPAGAGRTTLCPTEILHDAARPPALRLLPIQTRASPKSLREFLAEPEAWEEVALDPARPETVAPALQAISELLTLPAADAANLGFAPEGDGDVEIPRWRYAVVNFPHPLLRAGLVILDTPGHNTFASEPELTLNRIPDADAIVFLLAVDSGVTRTDRELWTEHIEPIGTDAQNHFIVLNKIDGLRDGLKSETQMLSEIDRQVRSTAEDLGVDPTRIFALSAKQGLVGRIQNDRDQLMRSRLYRLEQALAQGLLHRRRLDHATSVRAEARTALAEIGTLLESRRGFTAGQLEELGALQGRNQKLVEALSRKASDERARLEGARTAMLGLRGVHNRHADELAALLNPNLARDAGIAARTAILDSPFSRGIGDALDRFFGEARERITRAIVVFDDVKKVMATVSDKFVSDYGIATIDVPPFGTERFLVELDRLQALCARDFRSTSSLLMRRRKTLGALFFDTVALKAIHVFEIADRESRTWMNGFIRPLEAQITAFQDQANSRIEGMGRIRNAEVDLVTRVAELEALLRDVNGQRREFEGHEERLLALLDVQREASLA